MNRNVGRSGDSPSWHRAWVALVTVLSGAVALMLGVVVGFQLYAPQVVQQFDRVRANTANNTLVYDAEDNLLAAVEGVEDRHAVPISRISPYMQKAVVAIEDRRFFAHRGLDPVRLLGALWADIKAMAFHQGASTITQQLVKLTLLSPERTLTRKVKEIFMAVALEQAYPKLKLLEFYLNRVYFGYGVYGVEQAARAYFDTSAAELTLEQAAFLAALVKKPEGYLVPDGPPAETDSPHLPLERLDELMERQRLVVETLRQLGWITPAEYRQARRSELVALKPKPDLVTAPYFVQSVLKRMRELLGVEQVSGRGYRVYTTLDPTMQQAAEQRVAELSASREEALQAAVVMMAPQSGHVRALVGGVDYGASQFNRAVQARRQPGSAFKPLVYAMALENGYDPNTVFVDEPVRYVWNERGVLRREYPARDGEPISAEVLPAALFDAPGAGPSPDAPPGADGLELAPDEAVYAPANFNDHYGEPAIRADGTKVSADRRLTLQRALELSSNVIAVQLLDELGISPVVRLGRRLGITVRRDAGLCIALGCSEVSLMELTAAYGMFANGGVRADPVFIRRITNSRGDVLYEHYPNPPEQVVSPWTAFRMSRMLQAVVARGTGVRARLERPVGGKTGTNDGPRDAWFVGFTPQVVGGVWVGFDDNRVMPGEQGGRTPAGLWKAIMQASLPPYQGEAFPHPPQSYMAVRVCSITGKVATRWCPRPIVMYFRDSRTPTETCDEHRPGGSAWSSLPVAADGAAGASVPLPDGTSPPAAGTAAPAEAGNGPDGAPEPGLFARQLQEAFREGAPVVE